MWAIEQGCEWDYVQKFPIIWAEQLPSIGYGIGQKEKYVLDMTTEES